MKKEYKSLYSNNDITAAQYLTEYICSRIASKENKNLPMKFWQNKNWKKIYQWQVVAANALLAEGLTCVQIMAFLRSNAGKKVLSLGQKKIILDGCAKLQPVNVKHDITQSLETDSISDFIDSDITINDVAEKGASLWEKLQ